jgi:uncharacterized membrane protein YczE
LRQRPGAGTLANATTVGLVIDLVLSSFHAPHAMWARIALLAGAVIGNGIATGPYIGAGFGPGPRDGLSTGFLLGGSVGIGTVVYALAIGPITHRTIPALAIE